MTHTCCASLAYRRGLVLISCQDQVKDNFDRKATIGTIIMVCVANPPSVFFVSLLFYRLPLLNSIAVNDATRFGARISDIRFVPL
jgi:hypothetical protein